MKRKKFTIFNLTVLILRIYNLWKDFRANSGFDNIEDVDDLPKDGFTNFVEFVNASLDYFILFVIAYFFLYVY